MNLYGIVNTQSSFYSSLSPNTLFGLLGGKKIKAVHSALCRLVGHELP